LIPAFGPNADADADDDAGSLVCLGSKGAGRLCCTREHFLVCLVCMADEAALNIHAPAL
jgi:hypothetical protein